jgi:transposase
MRRKDVITMGTEEIRRYQIVEKTRKKELTQQEGGEILGLSVRQIQRLVKKVREQGVKGVVHGLRGKPSYRKIPEAHKKKLIGIYQRKYLDFGPTLACEKLEEREGLQISRETLRQWLMEEGLWRKHRKGKKHRIWRERKACCGQMVQMDGSHHDWLEGRGPPLVLMAYIDDATSRTYGRFYEYEGTLPAMDSFTRYIARYGYPQSIYLDRHETYKSPQKLTVEEELEGKEASQSQFQRALEELGVQVIYAHSPQAKGRIERLFHTFQDRLVKEMRLERISSMEQANRFLEDYLPRYNQRFTRQAVNPLDLHHCLPKRIDLRKILCIQEPRCVRQDGTIRYLGRWYQIRDSLRPKSLWVQEWIDGTLHLVYQKKEIAFHEIFPSPKTPIPPSISRIRVRLLSPPALDHPWRENTRGKIKNQSPLTFLTPQGNTLD